MVRRRYGSGTLARGKVAAGKATNLVTGTLTIETFDDSLFAPPAEGMVETMGMWLSKVSSEKRDRSICSQY